MVCSKTPAKIKTKENGDSRGRTVAEKYKTDYAAVTSLPMPSSSPSFAKRSLTNLITALTKSIILVRSMLKNLLQLK